MIETTADRECFLMSSELPQLEPGMKVAVSFYAKHLDGGNKVFAGFLERWQNAGSDSWGKLWEGDMPKDGNWHLMKADLKVPQYLRNEAVLRLLLGSGPGRENTRYLLDDISMETIEAGKVAEPKKAVVHSFDKDDVRDDPSRYGVYWPPWKTYCRTPITTPQDYDKTMEEIGRELDLMERIGIKWIRSIWRWDKVEWNKGDYDFTLLDHAVAEAWKRGIRFVPCLATPPRWASTAPEGASDFRTFPPKTEDWADFVYHMVDHFKQHIKYWEIWNEPNVADRWSGTVEDYYGLLKTAYYSAKKADPQCKILMGAFSGSGRAYLDKLLGLGAKQHFDILSCHPYPGKQGGPDKVDFRVRNLRLVLAEHGCEDRPIWFTEIGWSVAKVGDSAQQAQRLTELYTYPFNEAVEKIFWFTFDSWGKSPGGYCMISTYGGKIELLDAYHAYGKVTGKAAE